MALTLNQILARLIAVEATLADNQTALDNLATRRELKNLIALLTAEVDSLRTQVENLDQTILSTVLREYLDDRFYQKSEYIDITHGVTDAASPVLTNDSGLIDTSFLPPSVVDHGELTGLEDNDHTQYFNDTEDPIVASGQKLTLNINPTDFLISGEKLQIKDIGIDHGNLSGIGDDDHTQYVPVNASRGFAGAVLGVAPTADLHLSTKKYVDDAIAGFSTDHGDLTGLEDDDHSQYLTEARHTALAGEHVTNGDSHDHSGGDGAQIDHALLSNLNSTDYSHISAAEKIDLTDGGITTLHSHTPDHVAATVSAVPLTIVGQAISFNYDPTDFLCSGNNLAIRNAGINHAGLEGLSRDDHTQYIPRDGTRGLTDDWDAGDFEIHAENLDGRNEGILEEPTITDAGSSKINITSAEVLIRDNALWNDDLLHFVVPAITDLACTNNATNWIVVNYNSGSPVYQALSSNSTINNSAIIPVARVYISSGVLDYQVSYGTVSRSAAIRNFDRIMRIRGIGGIERESGFAISETATRVINLEAGVVWFGVNRTELDAIVQGAGGVTSELWYHSAGNWTKADITAYNNTQYDNGTNLATLTNNRYAVNWVFRNIVTDEIDVVLGRGDYTAAQATASTIPALPSALTGFYVLCGRIIVKKSINTAYEIESVSTDVFQTASVTDHGDLSGLTDDDHTQYFLADGTRSVSGSILPATNNLYDIGSSAFSFRRIYGDAIIASGIKCTTHPLGLGMKYGLTSHSLTSEDVIIGGKLEIDDQVFFDGNTYWLDNKALNLGTGNDTALYYSTAQVPNTTVFAIGNDSNNLLLCERADIATNFAHSLQTNPTLFIQSADATNIIQWISFAHNQTDGVIGVGKGGVEFVSSGVNMFHIDGTLGEIASERQIYSVAASTLEPAGTTVVIDWSLSNTATLDLGSASGNITVSMWHTESGSSYVLKIIQSATARTITWPATVKWEGGSIPTLSTTNDAVDMAFFVCVGTTLYGSFGSNYS